MKITYKPWGKELLYETSPYVIKELHINPNSRLSLQYHSEKVETLVLVWGEGYIDTGNGLTVMERGQWQHIAPLTKHRIGALSHGATFFEVSIGQDEDIVRLEDDYGRGGMV